jgi:hypothetical protein
MRVLSMIIVCMLAVLVTDTPNAQNDNMFPTQIHLEPLHEEPTPIQLFMQRIATIETPGGGYQTTNKFGMLGRYQFSPSTIRVLGYDVTKSEFLNTPELQDSVMIAYMVANEKQLRHLISRYEGTTFKGIRITRASILAGAHFAGSGGVVAFFNNDDLHGRTDAFGTSLRKYMSMFSDFHLPPIVS